MMNRNPTDSTRSKGRTSDAKRSSRHARLPQSLPPDFGDVRNGRESSFLGRSGEGRVMEPNPYESPTTPSRSQSTTPRARDYKLLSVVIPFGVGVVLGGLNMLLGTSGINDPALVPHVCAGAFLGGFWGLAVGLGIRTYMALRID
jgi:hypothetical protein